MAAQATIDAGRLHPYGTDAAVSRDGTTISYRVFGSGPGVVILHGTMSSAYNHEQLAEALADAFTVYVPDRRGRLLSGPYGPRYGIAREVEDLAAVMARTGARAVFGVSSGGIIALRAAAELPAIRRAAIFEPPLFMDERMVDGFVARYDDEIAEGKTAAALVTAMRGAQMGPPIFNAMPRWLTERLVAMMLKQEDRKGAGPYVPMRALAPTLHYDFALVQEARRKTTPFDQISADVLLMGGSKSPAYLKAALDHLETLLPSAARVELADCDHAASWNADRGGRPAVVAAALRRFLAE
jgi:pimeloyl-ACP methyl ester carboxylesterase